MDADYHHLVIPDQRFSPQMTQKRMTSSSFFEFNPSVLARTNQCRPVSVFTEFVDTDLSDDEYSDDGKQSPRASIKSAGGPSITTVASYDEVQTPRSTGSRPNSHSFFPEMESVKPVEGPKGPHLFRLSTDLPNQFSQVLSLSPISPQTDATPTTATTRTTATDTTPIVDQAMSFASTASRPTSHQTSVSSPSINNNHPPATPFTTEFLNPTILSSWTPEMVAQSMSNIGIDQAMAAKFIENDITGSILLSLKFEDLKELGILSFGLRTRIWHQITMLQETTPIEDGRAPTPIEDTPNYETKRVIKREARVRGKAARRGPHGVADGPSNDVISPMESVSIVGIEHTIPKPHYCSKGESCSRHQKQARMIEAFAKQYPFVDLDAGKIIIRDNSKLQMTTTTAAPVAQQQQQHFGNDDADGPMSDVEPSVVASSDVLGPGNTGFTPLPLLEESVLRGMNRQDPQDNVRQFLYFQHQLQTGDECAQVPMTPPFNMTFATAAAAAVQNQAATASSPGHPFSSLSNICSAPNRPLPPVRNLTSPATTVFSHDEYHEHQQQQQQQYRHDSPFNAYRFGTPFSDMDVPVTTVPTGPIPREVSQSVPPNMNYRHEEPSDAGSSLRTQSRAGRRPSFPVVLAPLHENSPTTSPTAATHTVGHQRQMSASSQTRSHYTPSISESRPSFASKSPYMSASSFSTTALGSTVLSSSPPSTSSAKTSLDSIIRPQQQQQQQQQKLGDESDQFQSGTKELTKEGIACQGPMKKRRTRLLRHEWQDGFFTLRGTRLAMHANAQSRDQTIEYIDVDKYAIACTANSTTSKLRAAFKAALITHGTSGGGGIVEGSGRTKPTEDVASFSFQLIPQLEKPSKDSSGNTGGDVPAGKKDKYTPSALLGKRVSALGGGILGANPPAAATTTSTPPGPGVGPETINGTGKTHHFAVKGRNERIDWMRELMLAKALRQKGEGFEVRVNGNAV